MNPRAYTYVVTIVSAAIAVIALGQWDTVVAMSIKDIVGLTAFLALGIISEALAINFSVGGNKASSSISFVAVLACSLYFPPAATLLAAVMMQVVADTFIQRRKFWVISFNAAQGTVSIASAFAMYRLVSGASVAPNGINVPALAVLVTTLFATNTLVFSGLFALRHNHSIKVVISNVVGPSAANLLYGMLASPAAILAAVVYDRLYIGGLLLMLLPLLLIRYSYLSQIQLQQANRDLLKVLIKTIETRDPYTSGHSLRVSNLARLIAEDLGLSRRRVEQVETAGLLHDIGKIDTIYTAIIQKPSDLTEDERRVIKTHAVKGAEFLKSMTSLSDAIIEGVRHHHERFDGMGYPDGLRGTAIPLYSRIIMICDAIDAMLSDRPYRAALTVDRVQDELLRCSGTQFDPEIAGVIIRCGTLTRAQDLVRAQTSSLEELAVGAGSH
jgi:putative nucleotidyltransferase with HDIG domain